MEFRNQFFRIASLTILILGMFISFTEAQNIGSIDFENLRASELSDQQVQRIWERAQSEGYSISQLEQMALARGMQPAEVSRLVSRLRTIRVQGDQSQDQQTDGDGQLRQVNADASIDTLRQTFPDSTDEQELNIFGANMFRSGQISFTPSMNIPTPDNYQLGPGDEIVIDIWGAAEQTYRRTISPEGTISIANLGPIYLNGLSIEQARERIREILTKIYSGLREEGDAPTDTHARISLGNIRSISVTILGEALNPGTYTIPSLATVFNALYAAGGPANSGTFRDIEVIRGDSVAATLDIYDFLVYGDQSDNIRLRDQDIIKIDPYISRVNVEGNTKRNGLFELRQGETLQDLITFAGGFTDNAYTKRIKIVSNTESQKRIDDVPYPQERDFVIPEGAQVTVGQVLDRYENRVEIKGAVYRPGYYELEDTTTVYSLIKRAEGLRPDVFMNRGLIYREQEDLTLEAIPFNVRDVMNNTAQHDIPLKRNDVIQITSIFSLRDNYTVSISGEVQDPGSVEYAENMTLEDLIFHANGFTEAAAPYRIEVSRRITDGDSTIVPREMAEIFQFSVDENLELGAQAAEFTLRPFDRVYVRSSPSYFAQQEVTIQGEVLFPGDYTLDEKYMRISDLIQRAGGLSQYAYPKGASLTRRSTAEVETEFLNIPDSLRDDNAMNPNRTRVGIQLEEILQNQGSPQDLILRPGDVLEIPKELQTVQVAGEVLYPVSVRYQKNLNFREYIRAAGGASELGMPKHAYIVYANGEVDRASKFLFFRNYPDIRPGATIYVPQQEAQRELSPQERISIFSAIVSMAAIVSSTIFQIRRN